ncbi:MAG: carboxypeptidase regulatory-like domain-containing protein, partial [Acidobacteriota bacterium]
MRRLAARGRQLITEERMKVRLPQMMIGALALLALTGASVVAQVGRIEGEVKKQGTTEPIVGALVQIVRTDIKGSYDVPTDKKGRFLHAGVPYSGTYTLLVSAAGFAPTYLGGIRPTGEMLQVELGPGDGHKLTIEEVRAATGGGKQAAGGGGSAPAAKQPSAADTKKVQEENAKRTAENEKAKSDFENMKKLFEEGKLLATNKDFGGAIVKFAEAEKLDVEQHVVPANLALALYNRGATQLNAGQRDPAKQDFTDSVAAATRALAVNEALMSDPAKAPDAKRTKVSYLKIRADAESVLAKRFTDTAAADAAVADYKLAASISENPEEKKSFPIKGAVTLFEAGVADKAVVAFEEILATDPDNIDALYNLGLAFASVGKFQESANTLQKFVDKAPESDARVADTKAVIKDLIVGNNLQAPKADDRKGRPAPRKKP